MLELDNDEAGTNMAEYYNNGVDFGLGMEYQVAEMVNWGLGFTSAPKKLKDDYQNEMEFENTTLWLNTGATISVNEKLGFDVAFQVGVPTESYRKDLGGGLYQEYTKGMAYSIGLGVHYTF